MHHSEGKPRPLHERLVRPLPWISCANRCTNQHAYSFAYRFTDGCAYPRDHGLADRWAHQCPDRCAHRCTDSYADQRTNTHAFGHTYCCTNQLGRYALSQCFSHCRSLSSPH